MPAPANPSDRALLMVAWLNALVHATGLVGAAWGMRPGTPLVGLGERLNYLAEHPLPWQLGWGVWMLCVPAVIAFFALTSQRLAQSALARVAFLTAMAAGAVDLCCDTIFLLVLPDMAQRPVSEALFLTVERATGAVSLIVANGLYSTASLLLTLAVRGEPGRMWPVLFTGYAVAGFGSLLVVAGFSGVPWHAEWATGPTIGLYCVWTILMARAVRSTGAPP